MCSSMLCMVSCMSFLLRSLPVVDIGSECFPMLRKLVARGLSRPPRGLSLSRRACDGARPLTSPIDVRPPLVGDREPGERIDGDRSGFKDLRGEGLLRGEPRLLLLLLRVLLPARRFVKRL